MIQAATRRGKVETMNDLQALKRGYIEAEEKQRDAYRRAVWMERHLYDAPTGDDFSTRLASLKTQEKELQRLGALAMIARANYAAAEMAAR